VVESGDSIRDGAGESVGIGEGAIGVNRREIRVLPQFWCRWSVIVVCRLGRR